MYFDRQKFFKGYRAEFGSLSQQQVDGLNRLLRGIENDPHVTDMRWAAYMFATVYHETAHTFQPIHEYGGKAYFVRRYGGQTKKGRELGNDTPDEGYYYAGKGDVQLTGESNYEKAEDALRREYPEVVAAFEKRTGKKFDLTVGDQPDDESDVKNVMDPEISYAIMSYGMRYGMFTSRKLSDYFKSAKADWKNARRIINGTDKADLIAGYAQDFWTILQEAYTGETAPEWQEGERPKDLDPAPTPEPAKPTESPISTPPTEAVPVQTVTTEKKAEESSIDSTLKTWSARFVAVPAVVIGWVGALFAWLKDSPVNLIISLVAASAAVAIVYIMGRHIYSTIKEGRDAKLVEADKQRQHEIQMALIDSAASNDKQAVALVPPPVEMPATEVNNAAA